MLYQENGHIKITNPIVRNFKSPQWVLTMMCAMLLDPNQPNQCFTASLVRARERQIRAPKIGILGVRSRGSYTDNVTVYPYNRYIQRYKSYHTTCYVTNLHPKADACKSTRSKTCRNTTFTWLERARPSTKSRARAMCHHTGRSSEMAEQGSYTDNDNGHSTGTNMSAQK